MARSAIPCRCKSLEDPGDEQSIGQRIGRFLQRQGLLERDPENSSLAGAAVDEAPAGQPVSRPVTYRVAAGPQDRRKVFAVEHLA